MLLTEDQIKFKMCNTYVSSCSRSGLLPYEYEYTLGLLFVQL